MWRYIVCLLCVLKFSAALFEDASNCIGRCYARLDKTAPCQCNYACARYGDCCPDFNSLCKNGGGQATAHPQTATSAPGGHVVSAGGIADKLWQVDPDKFDTSDFTLDIGAHTSSGRSTDVSHSNLFSYVNTAKLNAPIYQAMMALWDNYTPDRGVADPVSASDRTEINHFLDLVLASPVMDETYNYLTSNHIFTGDKTAFRNKLYSLWFEPYSRSGGSSRDSSGFEHVFVGEYKSSIVEGFHNWVRLYKEELAGHVNYLGYMKQAGPNLLEFTFTWNGHHKNIDSLVFGSSPVFDMALGTICILSRPSSSCPFILSGHRFSIKQYDESHTSGIQIATAYIVI